MTSSQRKVKKTIIASSYIIILATIIFVIINSLFPNIQKVIVEQPNIQPIQITRFGKINVNELYSDFWAEINNPNDNFGASELNYTFVLKDKEGNLEYKNGTTFILPGDKKRYVLLLNLSSEYELEKFELKDSPTWQSLSRFNVPELVIRNVSIGISDKVGNAFTVFGVLTNSSPINLKNIQVIAILTDENKNIIGVNQTLVRDVLTSESRDFEMIWQNEILNSSINNTTIYAQSNILKDKELLLQLQNKPIFNR